MHIDERFRDYFIGWLYLCIINVLTYAKTLPLAQVQTGSVAVCFKIKSNPGQLINTNLLLPS